MRSYVLATALALAASSIGCKSSGTTHAPSTSSASAEPSASGPPSSSAVTSPSASAAMTPATLKEVGQGDGAFAATLYRALATEAGAKPGNRLLSPLSIRVAFAMALAGAKGETAAEMKKALALQGSDEELHDGFRGMLTNFESRAKAPSTSGMSEYQRNSALSRVVTLRIANRIWGQAGHAFSPAFKSTLEAKYVAPLEQLDFAKNADLSRKRINGWVEEKTEQKIKDLIPSGALDGAPSLVLTNAVYFKAAWHNPFVEKLTVPATFFVDGTRSVKVPTMNGSGRAGYAETPNATVLELPYADESLSMFFVLPKTKTGLKAIEDGLQSSDLAAWRLCPRQLTNYAIPKFKFESGAPDLISTMKALGMMRAFKLPDADFSGMDGKRDLFIAKAIHKTFIDLNEKGTEAAAATALMMTEGAAPEAPKTFTADHPFLFFIYDRKTDSILFLGRITSPG